MKSGCLNMFVPQIPNLRRIAAVKHVKNVKAKAILQLQLKIHGNPLYTIHPGPYSWSIGFVYTIVNSSVKTPSKSLHDFHVYRDYSVIVLHLHTRPLSKGPRKYQPGPVVLEQFDSSEAQIWWVLADHSSASEGASSFSPIVVCTFCCCFYWSKCPLFPIKKSGATQLFFLSQWNGNDSNQVKRCQENKSLRHNKQKLIDLTKWSSSQQKHSREIRIFHPAFRSESRFFRFMLLKHRNWIAGFFTAGGPWRWNSCQLMSCFNTASSILLRYFPLHYIIDHYTSRDIFTYTYYINVSDHNYESRPYIWSFYVLTRVCIFAPVFAARPVLRMDRQERLRSQGNKDHGVLPATCLFPEFQWWFPELCFWLIPFLYWLITKQCNTL